MIVNGYRDGINDSAALAAADLGKLSYLDPLITRIINMG
jgi:hypothetical protein